MKKIKTLIFSFVAVLIGLFTLCSCTDSSYNLYIEWSKAVSNYKLNTFASLEEDNIYEVITVDEAKTKIDDKETFILVVATLEVNACIYEIPYLDVTAKELGWEGKVYYINATDILKSTTSRLDVKDKLGISNVNAPNESEKYYNRELVLAVYKNGKMFLDTSNLNDLVVNDFYKLPSASQSPYEALSVYLFKDSGLDYTCLK